MSRHRGLTEKTKRMIILKIKHENKWAFKNRLTYCRRQVKTGTMTQETLDFVEEVIKKRENGEL